MFSAIRAGMPAVRRAAQLSGHFFKPETGLKTCVTVHLMTIFH
jgi:hypothetical protein